jgi:hypothetical protein
LSWESDVCSFDFNDFQSKVQPTGDGQGKLHEIAGFESEQKKHLLPHRDRKRRGAGGAVQIRERHAVQTPGPGVM